MFGFTDEEEKKKKYESLNVSLLSPVHELLIFTHVNSLIPNYKMEMGL